MIYEDKGSKHDTRAEKTIQREIEKVLQLFKVQYSITDAAIVVIGNQVRRTKVRTGWPDITGILHPDGRFFCIETKKLSGKLRESQEDILHRIEKSGGIVIISRSASFVYSFLSQYYKKK